MGLLEGKNALIFGLANDKSIAWGITQAFKREGANIGISYAGEILERCVKPLAEQVECKWIEECDVTNDEQIAALILYLCRPEAESLNGLVFKRGKRFEVAGIGYRKGDQEKQRRNNGCREPGSD